MRNIRNRKPQRPLTKIQSISLFILWVALVVLLIVYYKGINFESGVIAIASGLIILLAISKNR